MNLILLVQTPADAAALPSAAEGLKRLTPDAIWVVHSPAVLVDLTAANAQTEQQMAAIQQAIYDCIGREDYTGAENYKQQRHALTLQKATQATEGYKSMTEDQINAATERVFGAFWKAQPAPKMCLTMTTQHHETGDWIELVNSLKSGWKSETPHGQFMLTWPGQFATKTVFKEWAETSKELKDKVAVEEYNKLVTPPAEPKKRKVSSGYTGHSRFKQLCSMGIDALGQTALGYKLDPNGLGRLKLAHLIGKHEETNSLLDNPKM